MPGFQYEIGKEYETDKAKVCRSGFHACEYPLNVFKYYPPSDSRYCEVEQSGEISKDLGDSKTASTKIKIGAEIGIKGLVSAAFEFVKERCTTNKQGTDHTALTGGNRSALTGGYMSALTGGDRSVCYADEGSKVKAGLRSVIAIQYWVDDEFKCIKFAEVDGERIKADAFYTLDDNGEFVEVKE